VTDIDELARQVQELRDLEAIRQLKHELTRLGDQGKWEEWGALCTEDLYFDSDGGVMEGRDAIVANVSKALADASTVHHVYAPLMEITGPDTATASWRMEDWVRMTHKGQAMAFHGHGFYHEDYVRTPDGWRLSRCVMERIRVDPMEP
jgi:3-phenylpropionate/cinnamic acid dioxygenase small subunit